MTENSQSNLIPNSLSWVYSAIILEQPIKFGPLISNSLSCWTSTGILHLSFYIMAVRKSRRVIMICLMFLAVDRVHVNVLGQLFMIALIKWRYTACVLQRGSISPADKYNRARTPQEPTHHSHHSQNHHDHPLHPMKKMKKELETCKDTVHVSA